MMSFFGMSQKKDMNQTNLQIILNTLVMIGVLCVKQTGVVYRLNCLKRVEKYFVFFDP